MFASGGTVVEFSLLVLALVLATSLEDTRLIAALGVFFAATEFEPRLGIVFDFICFRVPSPFFYPKEGIHWLHLLKLIASYDLNYMHSFPL